MRSKTSWMMAAGLLAIGLVAGRYVVPSRPAAPAAQRTTTVERKPYIVRVPVAGGSSSNGAVGIDRDALRAELRAALGELGVGKGSSATDESLAPAPVEPTAEQRESATRGGTLVADAVSRGRWGERDGTQLRELLGTMNAKQRLETVAALTAAINRGEIVPDSPRLF